MVCSTTIQCWHTTQHTTTWNKQDWGEIHSNSVTGIHPHGHTHRHTHSRARHLLRSRSGTDGYQDRPSDGGEGGVSAWGPAMGEGVDPVDPVDPVNSNEYRTTQVMSLTLKYHWWKHSDRWSRELSSPNVSPMWCEVVRTVPFQW